MSTTTSSPLSSAPSFSRTSFSPLFFNCSSLSTKYTLRLGTSAAFLLVPALHLTRRQILRNSSLSSRQHSRSLPLDAMFGLLYGFYSWLVEKKEYHVLIIGLDNAGKTTLLERTNYEFNKRGLPPEKIRPTVGLNIGRIETKGMRLSFFDLGGQTGLRSIWEKYYADSNAVLFVVDSADAERLQEAKQTFEMAMEEPKLENLPVLLMVNKQDREDSQSAESISELFEVQNRTSSRRIRVQPVSAITGAGIAEGIKWIADTLSSA